ncbi:IclR family transcriptional regulator [Nocardioides sp. DS6]|uniref:IclR family transcriptional regulator n=1 Tax=Nocardioides eburneus TaxID=3231482 RepID=A0ABV3T419_9ACTN
MALTGKKIRTGEEDRRSLSTRTMDVLASFDARHPRRTLSDIARATGLPLSTAHRIVTDLLRWGALEETSAGYQVGIRLWETATRAPRGPALREAALTAMEDLYEATHQNVQLAVRDGLEVVYVERFAGRGAVRVLTTVGGRFALHATGVGLVLLAHAPTEVQEQVLRGSLRAWTPYTVTDPRKLRASLAEVRRTGVAVADRQVTSTPAAVSIACPIHDADGSVVAALSLVLPAEGPTKPTALIPAVRAASRSVSQNLGFRGGVPRMRQPG